MFGVVLAIGGSTIGLSRATVPFYFDLLDYAYTHQKAIKPVLSTAFYTGSLEHASAAAGRGCVYS